MKRYIIYTALLVFTAFPVLADCTPPPGKSYLEPSNILVAEYVGPGISFANLKANILPVRSSLHDYQYRFRVLEVFKGDFEKGQIISFWGGPYKEGDKKVLYLSHSKSTGRLYEHACLRIHSRGYFLDEDEQPTWIDVAYFRRYKKDVEEVEKKLSQNPHSIEILLEKATILESYSDFEAAVDAYKAALQNINQNWQSMTREQIEDLPEKIGLNFDLAISGLIRSLGETRNKEKAEIYRAFVSSKDNE